MINQAVRRPVAILMVFAGLVILGWQGKNRLALDLLPAINYPNLTVITNYADTPADDLVRLVTEPLEEVVFPEVLEAKRVAEGRQLRYREVGRPEVHRRVGLGDRVVLGLRPGVQVE